MGCLSCAVHNAQDLRFNACVPVSQLVGVGRGSAVIHSAVLSYALTSFLFFDSDGDGAWYSRNMKMNRKRNWGTVLPEVKIEYSGQRALKVCTRSDT